MEGNQKTEPGHTGGRKGGVVSQYLTKYLFPDEDIALLLLALLSHYCIIYSYPANVGKFIVPGWLADVMFCDLIFHSVCGAVRLIAS